MSFRLTSLCSAALLGLAALSSAQVAPDAALLRYPDVSASQIVFRYAGDLWLVDKLGGTAQRVTTVAGNEALPRFSPDGTEIAFMGGYEGGTDLYRMNLAAGVPLRVTQHPGQEVLNDWTPDGESLLFWSSEVSGLRRASRIMQVNADGGQPQPLPVPYGAFAAIDATGTWLAYTLGSREFRTWKRYTGGMAQDVWLYNLKTGEAKRMTDHPGTDSVPMWHGRSVVFLSDRGGNGRMNLHSYDLDDGSVTRLTEFADVDVKFPAIGPQDIVFTADGDLYRYELESKQLVPVSVLIPGERPNLGTRTVDVSAFRQTAHPGPSGTRLLVEARGDIFNVPAEDGITRNLTRTDGIAEREPVWSPDGHWLAYFSDRSGEYELTLRRVDGGSFDGGDDSGQRTLSSIGTGWKSNPNWSPNSEKLTFATNDGGVHLVDVASGDVKRIHTHPDAAPLMPRWSQDSGWMTWSHRHTESLMDAIFLYDVEAGTTHCVTSGMFDDSNPVFDRNGDWLYFHSTREFDPIYEDLGSTWIYANSRALLAVPLRADVENPFLPEDAEEAVEEDEVEEETDEEGDEEGDEDSGDDSDSADESDEDEEEDERMLIELDGFEARALMLPVDPGSLSNLEAGENGVFYVAGPRTGSGGGDAALMWIEMGEDEPETVLGEIGGGYNVSADGKRAVVFNNGKVGMADLSPDSEFKAVDLSQMRSTIDPRNEWPQLINDVHRLYRDFFYDEGMHGVDWDGIRDRYLGALKDATSRDDVQWFIGEMIAELNVGHAYNRSPAEGLERGGNARPVGLLGCDWEVVDGAFRIARILGDVGGYDADARSPLAIHGVDANAGDYLLAVNGVDVDTARSVHWHLDGTVGATTELLLNAAPTRDGNERKVLVEPIGNEGALRYRDWVSQKRALVDRLSGGRVGYVHVPDTGQNGQNELMRQYLGQMHKDALVVDERWNGGGQIPDRFIELLNRPTRNFWALRDGEDWDWPRAAHQGPKAMLINGWSGSGGDCFPYYFRQSGLGKLIGRRTWGGLVGMSGNPSLIDGASPTVPRFAFYELDGTWGVEGYGVDPDIEVMDDPSLMIDGGDPQLEVAITHLLEELKGWAGVPKNRPAGPNRAGMGPIPDSDR